MKKNYPKEIKKILIRGVDEIGVMVLVSPFYRIIRENFSDSYITVCTKTEAKILLESFPYIDDIIEYNCNNIFEKNTFIKKLRKKKYDMAILLSGSFESALMCYLAKIPIRIGYPTDGRKFLLTDVIKKENKPVTKEVITIAQFMNLKISSEEPEIFLTKQDEIDAIKLFEQNNLMYANKIVGIGFETDKKVNKWPLQNFSNLINMLAKKGVQIILFGSKNGIVEAEEIQKLCKTKVINLVGKTNIRQFAACVKKCNVYVTIDTGGMHIAGVVGTVVIALFGSENPINWKPPGKNISIIQTKVSCAPCYSKRKRCKNNICMKSITVEEVYKKTIEKL